MRRPALPFPIDAAKRSRVGDVDAGGVVQFAEGLRSRVGTPAWNAAQCSGTALDAVSEILLR